MNRHKLLQALAALAAGEPPDLGGVVWRDIVEELWGEGSDEEA